MTGPRVAYERIAVFISLNIIISVISVAVGDASKNIGDRILLLFPQREQLIRVFGFTRVPDVADTIQDLCPRREHYVGVSPFEINIRQWTGAVIDPSDEFATRSRRFIFRHRHSAIDIPLRAFRRTLRIASIYVIDKLYLVGSPYGIEGRSLTRHKPSGKVIALSVLRQTGIA